MNTNTTKIDKQAIIESFKKHPSVHSLDLNDHKLHFPVSCVPQTVLEVSEIVKRLQSGSMDASPLAKLDGKTVMVQWRKVQKSSQKLSPKMQRVKEFKSGLRAKLREKKNEIAREARKAAQEKKRAMMAEIKEDCLATHQIEHPLEHQALIEGLQLDEAQKKKRAENRQAAKLAKEESADPDSVESSGESSDEDDDADDE